jgi:hypothetical protein
MDPQVSRKKKAKAQNMGTFSLTVGRKAKHFFACIKRQVWHIFELFFPN